MGNNTKVIFHLYHFTADLRHKEKNNKKITQAGGVCNQQLPLALSTFLWQNLQIFGTKPFPCRRFLQHYYRGASKIGSETCKAEYGKAILADLSTRLTDEFGKGFDERELRRIRQFYLVFPKWDALRPE